MKNLYYNLLVIFMIINTSSQAQHMVHYTNEKDGYALKFPEEWKRADEFDGRLSLVALAPEESEAEDGVRESLNLALFDLKDRNLSIFYAHYKTSHEEKNRSWKLNNEGEILAQGQQALLFGCYYSDSSSGRTHGEIVYIYQKQDHAVVLTCTTSFDELEKYTPTFNKIAQSFSTELAPQE